MTADPVEAILRLAEGAGAVGPAAASAATLRQALSLQRAGQLEQAETIYQSVLQRQPDDFHALRLLGTLNSQRGKHLEAVRLLRLSLDIRPRQPAALNNLGIALRELHRFEDAVSSYDKALALKPDYTAAYNNRGVALAALNRHEDALASFDASIGLDPRNAAAYNNRGNVLNALRRHQPAVESFERAIALEPGYADAHWNQACTCLSLGDFARGWNLHEWRWKRGDPASPKRDFSRPLWLGREDVSGKTVLLHAEQGFGDTIQFCRYAPMLAGRGAKVVLEVQPQLESLMGSLGNVARVIGAGNPTPDFDYHVPIMSLPLAFGTELSSTPAEVPYLAPNRDAVERWRTGLGLRKAPRIGLVWAGSASQKNDHNRSISLSDLLPLISLDAEFVSLQKDLRGGDAALLGGLAIRNCSNGLADFSETAALVSQLDLVISVDTAVAHLAGALGRPVWILLHHVHDWRWLLDREDSPWYPTARLFTQRRFDGWTGLIRKVREELAGWLGDIVRSDKK